MSAVRTKPQQLGRFVLHMEEVKARLEVRCADADLDTGACTLTLSIDERATLATDIGVSTTYLRELHGKLREEERSA